MTLDQANAKLAPLGKRIFHVRSQSGVMRYVLMPECDLMWDTMKEAVADLAFLWSNQ